MDSIKVAIKVRPLIKREKDENLSIQWVTQGNTIVATDAELRKRADGGFEFGMTLMCCKLIRTQILKRVSAIRFIYPGPSESRLSVISVNSLLFSYLLQL